MEIAKKSFLSDYKRRRRKGELDELDCRENIDNRLENQGRVVKTKLNKDK